MKVEANHCFDIYKGVVRYRHSVCSGRSYVQDIRDAEDLYSVRSSILTERFQIAVPKALRGFSPLNDRYIKAYIARCNALSLSFALAEPRAFGLALGLPADLPEKLIYPQTHGKFSESRAILPPMWRLTNTKNHVLIDLEIAPIAILLAMQIEELESTKKWCLEWVSRNNELGDKRRKPASIRLKLEHIHAMIDQRIAACETSLARSRELYLETLESRKTEIEYIVNNPRKRLPRARIRPEDDFSHQTTRQAGWIPMGAIRILPLSCIKTPSTRLYKAHFAFEVSGFGSCIGYLDYFRSNEVADKGAYRFLGEQKLYRSPVYPAPLCRNEPYRPVRKDLLKLEAYSEWSRKLSMALLELRKACRIPESEA